MFESFQRQQKSVVFFLLLGDSNLDGIGEILLVRVERLQINMLPSSLHIPAQRVHENLAYYQQGKIENSADLRLVVYRYPTWKSFEGKGQGVLDPDPVRSAGGGGAETFYRIRIRIKIIPDPDSPDPK